MTRLLFYLFFSAVTVLFGSCSLGQDDGSQKRLHFTLVKENEAAKLLPVDAAAPIAAGETRVSCREVEFCMKYNKPRTILIDARIEHIDSWLEGERIEIEYGSKGLQLAVVGLKRHFKTAEAEEKHAEQWRRRTEAMKRDSINRGMIESEKEHHKIVLEQLRRTFITGQRQMTKR